MEKPKNNLPAKRKKRSISKDVNFDKYFDDSYDDNIDRKDIKLPRIKIIQGSSKDKGKGKDGEFINSITNDCYGKPIKIIPIFHWKSQVMFDEKLNMIAQSLDHIVSNFGDCRGTFCKDCKLQKWNGDVPPDCNEVFNFAIAFPEELDEIIKNRVMLPPLILSLMRTGTTAAKYMVTNIRINRGRKIPIWANIIEITTYLKQFPTQPAWVPKAKIVGVVNPKEKIKADYLDRLHRSYKEMRLNVSFDDLIQDVEETESPKKRKPVKRKEIVIEEQVGSPSEDESEIPF